MHKSFIERGAAVAALAAGLALATSFTSNASHAPVAAAKPAPQTESVPGMAERFEAEKKQAPAHPLPPQF